MFSKEAGHVVEECKLKVVYVAPPQPPSPVPEGEEEGGSPSGSVSDNGNLSGSESATGSRAFGDSQDRPEAKTLIAKLTEGKNVAVQQNNKLRQELELLRGEASKGQGGFVYTRHFSRLDWDNSGLHPEEGLMHQEYSSNPCVL